tara:strand:+ start:929 stop:1159 length:231 start_codon:yes stop_codon:yes gene_type:complete
MDKKLHNRLRRLEGQLLKLHESIEGEKDCADVIPQFLAIKGALNGAYEEYIKLSLDKCAKSDDKKIKRLISMLVKA